MRRSMVERTFDGGLHIPTNEDGAAVGMNVVGGNAGLGVTWVHSYVSGDKNTTFCVCGGPDPESIRKAAEVNDPSVERITKVAFLDLYFYR